MKRLLSILLLSVPVCIVLYTIGMGKYGFGPRIQSDQLTKLISSDVISYGVSKDVVGNITKGIKYGLYTTNGKLAYPGYMVVVVDVHGEVFEYCGEFSYSLSRLIGDRVVMDDGNYKIPELAKGIGRWVDVHSDWKFFVETPKECAVFIKSLISVGFKRRI